MVIVLFGSLYAYQQVHPLSIPCIHPSIQHLLSSYYKKNNIAILTEELEGIVNGVLNVSLE